MVSEIQSVHAIQERNQKKKESDLGLKITPYNQRTMREKYLFNGIENIGYLDVECTNLDADFGHLLSWVLWIRDVQTGKIVRKHGDYFKQEDIDVCARNRETTFDKRMLNNLINAINDKKYPVHLLIGHYFHGWGKMDIPFIRTRLAECGLLDKFKKHRQIRFGDTWRMAHQTHKIHSYRLDSVGDIFGIKNLKTRLKGDEWILANKGDKKAVSYVYDHNKKDVKLTWKTHLGLEEFVPIPASYV